MSRTRDLADLLKNSGVAIPPVVSGKNFAINGAMDHWQRGTSFSQAANTLAYTSDRWQALTAASATATISRQTTSDTTNLPTIQYCARFQRNSGQTGTGDAGLFQSFETANSIPFTNKYAVLSFYARAGANYSPTSNILISSVYCGGGTDQNIFSYTGFTVAGTQNNTLTTTWQRFTVVVLVPSGSTEIGLGLFCKPTGTAGANDYFEVTGIQFELGWSATPFSRAGGSIGGELALCQRYYWRINAAPPSASNSFFTNYGPAGSSTQVYPIIRYPVIMRAAPSSVEYGGSLVLFDGVNTPVVTAIAMNGNTNVNQSLLTVTSSGLTQFRNYALFSLNDATSYVGFSAEL